MADDVKVPVYKKAEDIPHTTGKQAKINQAERATAESTNNGWVLGSNPRVHAPSPRNPNSQWDPVGKKFVRGTGYYDLQQPIPKK